MFLCPSLAAMPSFIAFIFHFAICISINGVEIVQGTEELLGAGKEKTKCSSFSLGFSTSFFFFSPGGMQALFKVEDCKKSTPGHNKSIKTRQYFIAAEETIWNYGPSAVNHFTGQELIHDR